MVVPRQYRRPALSWNPRVWPQPSVFGANFARGARLLEERRRALPRARGGHRSSRVSRPSDVASSVSTLFSSAAFCGAGLADVAGFAFAAARGLRGLAWGLAAAVVAAGFGCASAAAPSAPSSLRPPRRRRRLRGGRSTSADGAEGVGVGTVVEAATVGSAVVTPAASSPSRGLRGGRGLRSRRASPSASKPSWPSSRPRAA